MTPFQTNPVSLTTLLDNLRSGATQLPEFQRGWVWDEDRIRGLLASISRAFPIGAVMLLENGGETRFAARPVEGVAPAAVEGVVPQDLILDGQQRLTSLYQATLYGKAVATLTARGRPVRRWFYVDMRKALSESADEREEAFFAINEDRVQRSIKGVELDLSTREAEFARRMFPCRLLFDHFEWFSGCRAHHGHDPSASRFLDDFQREVIQPFQTYQLPVIRLMRHVPKEAVCHVFEKVNTGGVTLDAFELLTASYAAENFALRDDWQKPATPKRWPPDPGDPDDWEGVQRRFAKASAPSELPPEQRILAAVGGTDFLQAATLLATQKSGRGVSCKRAALLSLPRSDYVRLRRSVADGFVRAARFLSDQRIFTARDLPYRTQLVPLAAVLAVLGDGGLNHGTAQKLRRWYWCGVLGELYGGAVETRFASDVPDLLGWVAGGAEPRTVIEAEFSADRLGRLRTRNSAAYKGIYALLMTAGARDWQKDTPIDLATFNDLSLDIHHIFPAAWCDRHLDPKDDRWDSIVNKTAISSEINRAIGGRAPSSYRQTVLARAGFADPGHLDAILRGHGIVPEHLWANDFDAFFTARRTHLLDLIANAMGKPVGGASAAGQEEGAAEAQAA